jgi:hypothetical protein
MDIFTLNGGHGHIHFKFLSIMVMSKQIHALNPKLKIITNLNPNTNLIYAIRVTPLISTI